MTIQKMLLVGAACVGKTTIGEILANKIGYNFFDFDKEIESYFNSKIAKIQKTCFNGYDYILKTAIVLKNILDNNSPFVMALCPSGLHLGYSSLIHKSGATTICLNDTAENILNRIIFTDDDSNLISITLSEREKSLYYKKIRSDISYYRRINKKAKHHVDISNLTPDEAADKIISDVGIYELVSLIP